MLTAAIFELKGAEPVSALLTIVGGTSALANLHRIHVERIDITQPTAVRFVEEFILDNAGKNKPLHDGDVVTVLPLSPQFANAVTLTGAVAQPSRYPFVPGMRIHDLVPSAADLISRNVYDRTNRLVQMEGRADSRRPLRNDAPAPPVARALTSRLLPLRGSGQGKALDALFEGVNLDYATVERLDPQDLSTQVIPFSLRRAVLQGDASADIELQQGDVVRVYSQEDIRSPVSRQTQLVALEGEVNAPGVYQLRPNETMHGLIARAGGVTPHAYLYGLEFTRARVSGCDNKPMWPPPPWRRAIQTVGGYLGRRLPPGQVRARLSALQTSRSCHATHHRSAP